MHLHQISTCLFICMLCIEVIRYLDELNCQGMHQKCFYPIVHQHNLCANNRWILGGFHKVTRIKLGYRCSLNVLIKAVRK